MHGVTWCGAQVDARGLGEVKDVGVRAGWLGGCVVLVEEMRIGVVVETFVGEELRQGGRMRDAKME